MVKVGAAEVGMGVSDVPISRSTCRTTDRADIDRAVDSIWPGSTTGSAPEDEPVRWAHSAAVVGDLGVLRVRLSGETRGSTALCGTYVLTSSRRGAGTVRYGRDQPVDIAPLTLLPPDREAAVRLTGVDVLATNLEVGAVRRIGAALLADDGFDPVVDRPLRAVDAGAERLWDAQQAHLCALLLDGHGSLPPLVVAAVEQSTVALAVQVFGLTGPGAAPGGALSAGVRLAREHVHDRLDEPIGLADLAAASGLTARGLQAAFQRELGVTPMAYLRDRRLEAARRDLASADPTVDGGVAAVARRWGFTNGGRFATRYRARFGEPPSRTLGRG